MINNASQACTIVADEHTCMPDALPIAECTFSSGSMSDHIWRIAALHVHSRAGILQHIKTTQGAEVYLLALCLWELGSSAGFAFQCATLAMQACQVSIREAHHCASFPAGWL